MSFSPIVRVRKLLDKMKTDRESPRLKRFLSRRNSGADACEPTSLSSLDSMDWTPYYLKDYPTENFIFVLPPEAVLHIFSYLEVKDVRRVKCVNTEWSQLAEVDNLWKQLCHYDWNVNELLADTWQLTYKKLEDLFSEGHWEGMSKWVEPEGFDNEQKTTARLHFQKRTAAPLPKYSSPSMIRRVDSYPMTTPRSNALAATNERSGKFRESAYRINGSGVTINCSSHSYFTIEGERVNTDATGATFQWYKQFEKHTSVYVGKVDYKNATLTGTIDYNDGQTHWKGMFCYTKANKKTSKAEETRVA